MRLPCYHPLYAVQIGTKDNGKADLKFLQYRPHELDKTVEWHGRSYPRSALVPLPCGQCIGCRIDYSRQWANRCMMELEYHDSAYFVTLTYDDDHLPMSEYIDPDTGELLPSLTLRKRDFQLFMKRLRKAFPQDHIRFFMCGEYGSQTFRPHYHAIIYGLHLDDLTVYKTVREAGELYTYYNSPSLQKVWSDSDGVPIGFAVVGEVTWNSCSYVARYVMKKQKGSGAEAYRTFNIVPEFTLMSRKPGIAKQYYDDHSDLYDYDKINISTPKGGRAFRPPRYFDKLYDLDAPECMQSIKDRRKAAAVSSQAAKLQHTTLRDFQLREVEESNFESKLKSLRREL